MRKEAVTLWKQAEYEEEVATLLHTNKKYSAAAFHAQQTAEMALKAAYVEAKGELYLRHNLDELANKLNAPKSVKRAAAALIPIYLAARYADAREDDTTPAEAITEEDAREALNNAEEVLTWSQQTLKN